MGMDLYSKRKPRLKDKLYYRFNWSGWGSLCDDLKVLGCDLSEFSGSNDGDVVSPDSCMAIYDRVNEIFDDGRLEEVFTAQSARIGHVFGCVGLLYTDEEGLRNFLGNEEHRPEDCWVANYKKGTVTPPINPSKTMANLLSIPVDMMPVLLAEFTGKLEKEPFQKTCLELQMAEARLAGRELNLTAGINMDLADIRSEDPKGSWSWLGYVLGFTDFCKGCSKLGGFQQF